MVALAVMLGGCGTRTGSDTGTRTDTGTGGVIVAILVMWKLSWWDGGFGGGGGGSCGGLAVVVVGGLVVRRPVRWTVPLLQFLGAMYVTHTT